MTHFKTVTILAFLIASACSKHNTIVVAQNSLAVLNTNSGFESGLTGYEIAKESVDGTGDAISLAAHAGNLGVRLNKAALIPSLETLPLLDPNKVYMIGFWARAVVLDQPNVYPYLEVKTGFTDRVTYTPETLNKIYVKTATWTHYEYAIQPGARSGLLWLLEMQFTPGPGSDNVVDIDELTVEQVDSE